MNLSDRTRMRNHKRASSESVSYVLLLSGAIALVTSIVFSLYILAFTGLGLTFWGALLLYIKSTNYVKASLLDSTALSSLRTIDQIITVLNCKGKAVYLPPSYFKETKGGNVFIPSKKGTVIPPAKEVVEEKVLLKNQKGMCIIPPGVDLANLYEKELGKDFAKVDLNYLQNNLPKLFIEDLEIAEDLEINRENNIVQVKITGSIYENLCKEARKLSCINHSIGCPLCSSIAITLTRATGSPLIIEKIEVSKDGKTIKANFQLLETPKFEEQTEALLEEATELYLNHHLLSNLASLFLTAFGSIILAWIGWITWYDVTMWDKDVFLVFFGSRTGEPISLGIDMKLIHIFLIGLATLISGLLIFLRRRRSEV
jgi:hypothetical protein